MKQLSTAWRVGAFLIALSSPAITQTLVTYDPVGTQGSTVPVPPTGNAPNLTASDLEQSGFMGWGNTNVWPVGQLTMASPTVDLTRYVTFNVSAPSGLTFTSLSYSRRSYTGDGNRAAAVRSSIDAFATDIDVVTGLNPQGDVEIVFDLSAMPVAMGPTTFRIYFYDAPTSGADWVDLVSTASNGNGLVLSGTVIDDIGTNYCTANANSTGAVAAMGANGSTLASANDVTLSATGLPPFSFAFFLASRAQGFVMNPAGSQGNLCVGGAIGRYVGPGQIQQSGNPGTIELQIDLTLIPQPNGFEAVMPGDMWNFQAWYRDQVGGAATSNFTDGLEIVFQ